MVGLIDIYGKPLNKELLKKEQAAPTVRGIRQIISGHPAQGMTPARLAGILKDAEQGAPERYMEMAEEMEEKDLHYLSVLGTRKRAVAQLEITVEAASEDAGDQKNADMVNEFLRRDTLEAELFDILDAIGKGFSLTEIIWDLSGREWWPLRLEWRDPRWFEFDRVDGVTPLLRTESGPEPLAPFKFICHHHKAKAGLPIRGGLARAAAWSYLFKNYDIKDWVAFAEVYGQPIRVGKYHNAADEAEKSVLLRAVSTIGTDAAAIIPESMQIEFVEAKSASNNAEVFEKLANYLDRQVSKAVLGQTATTDAIAGGHAVGRTHDEVREDIERADARQLAATINRDIIRPFIDLNRGPQAKYPRLSIGRADAVDIDRFSNAVARVAGAGLRIKSSEVREKLGLSEPEDDDELLGPPVSDAPPVAASGQGCPVHGPAAAAAAAADDDAIDELAGAELDEWEEIISPVLAGIRDQLAAAENFEEAKRIIARALADMDSDEAAERLAGGTGAELS